MGELIKVEKILGKPYLMVGSADTDIILNGKGQYKFYFDTIKKMDLEGKINLIKLNKDGSTSSVIKSNTGNPEIQNPC